MENEVLMMNDKIYSSEDSHFGSRKYIFWDGDIGSLEGKLLTQLEASIQDKDQLKALKSVVRDMLWRWVEASTWCQICENGKKLEKLAKVTGTDGLPDQSHCKNCNMYYDK